LSIVNSRLNVNLLKEAKRPDALPGIKARDGTPAAPEEEKSAQGIAQALIVA
jgi:hypothetical protein